MLGTAGSGGTALARPFPLPPGSVLRLLGLERDGCIGERGDAAPMNGRWLQSEALLARLCQLRRVTQSLTVVPEVLLGWPPMSCSLEIDIP